MEGTPGSPSPAPRGDARRIGGRFGLYGPDSEAWQLNREATILLGAGPRALLMQIAHPLVAEGVDQHSGFREDPWGRLLGTIRSYLRIVFGSEVTARAEIRRLNSLHGAVRGPVVDPAARAATGAGQYRARDPELSLWVHATLIDSTFVAYDAWIEPLSRERRAMAYAETLSIGRALGVGAGLLPHDLDAFEAYMARMLALGSPVVVTPTARELAATILHPPLAPVVRTLGATGLAEGTSLRVIEGMLAGIPAAAYDWTMWPAIALLPERLRIDFDIRWSPRRRLVADWLVAGYRWWRPLLPVPFRSMPQALAADRRVGGD